MSLLASAVDLNEDALVLPECRLPLACEFINSRPLSVHGLARADRKTVGIIAGYSKGL